MSKTWDYSITLMAIMNTVLIMLVEYEAVFVKVLVIALNSFMWLFIALYFDLRSKTKVDAVNDISGSTYH